MAAPITAVRSRPVARLTTESAAIMALLRATELSTLAGAVGAAGPSVIRGRTTVASMSIGEPAGAAPMVAGASPSGVIGIVVSAEPPEPDQLAYGRAPGGTGPPGGPAGDSGGTAGMITVASGSG